MSAAADLDDAAAALAQFPTEAVRAAVGTFRSAILAQLRDDTGGDYALSGISRRRTTKLAVVFTVTGETTVTGSAFAGPKGMKGPWRWIESGTRPRVSRTGRRHPGTKPKGTWSKPVRAALPDVERDLFTRFSGVLR